MNIMSMTRHDKLDEYGLTKHGYDRDFFRAMLARMVADCEYYLGYGQRQSKHLWTHDPKEQIAVMWELYAQLGEEVDGWCPAERIAHFDMDMNEWKDMEWRY